MGNNRGGSQISPKWVKNMDNRVKHIEEWLEKIGGKIEKTADDYENMSFLVGVVRHQQKQLQEMNSAMMQQNMFTQKAQQFFQEEELTDKFNEYMKAQAEEMKKKNEESSPEDPPAPEESE